MKIYLAGKIAPRDWREAIVTNLHLPDVVSCPQADGDPFARDEWPVLPKAIFQTHDYVGPFFANCGHGCFYGDDSHGLGAGRGYYKSLHGQESRMLIDFCERAIQKCDLFFAWIDSLDCYGTITEIGYAHGLGKEIWVRGPRHFRDMWFPYCLSRDIEAYYHTGVSHCPKEALEAILEYKRKNDLHLLPYADYLKTDHWKETRQAALVRANFRCQVCNTNVKVLHVHHRTYERLGKELDTDLLVLCESCHFTFHRNGKLAHP